MHVLTGSKVWVIFFKKELGGGAESILFGVGSAHFRTCVLVILPDAIDAFNAFY